MKSTTSSVLSTTASIQGAARSRPSAGLAATASPTAAAGSAGSSRSNSHFHRPRAPSHRDTFLGRGRRISPVSSRSPTVSPPPSSVCRSYPPPHDPEAFERELADLRKVWAGETPNASVLGQKTVSAEAEVEATLAVGALNVPLPGPARYSPAQTFTTPDHHPCTVMVADPAQGPLSAAALAARRYSVWHEDATGARTLWIGDRFEPKRGLYAGMMRDEVYAVWHVPEGRDVDHAELHVHCSVTSSVLGQGPTYERILAALGSNLLRPSAASAVRNDVGSGDRSGDATADAAASAATPDPYAQPHAFWSHFAQSQNALRNLRSSQAAALKRLGGARWAIPFLLVLRELEDSMALFRKSIFIEHMPEVLYSLVLGDQAAMGAFPHLKDAPVFVHYHARPGECSQAQMVRLGTALECVQTSIAKNSYDPESAATNTAGGAGAIPPMSLLALKHSLKKAKRAREEVVKVWNDALTDLGGIQERCFFACTVGAARLLAELEKPARSVRSLAASLSGSLGGSLGGSLDEEEIEAAVSAAGLGSARTDTDRSRNYADVVPEPINLLNVLAPESLLILASTAASVAASDVQLGKLCGSLLVAGLMQMP